MKKAQEEFDRSSVHIEYGTGLSYFNSEIDKLREELLNLIAEELSDDENENEEEG